MRTVTKHRPTCLGRHMPGEIRPVGPTRLTHGSGDVDWFGSCGELWMGGAWLDAAGRGLRPHPLEPTLAAAARRLLFSDVT